MNPKSLKTELRETLQRIACHLDELSIDPTASESQSRHMTAAIRTLIPAFTIRSAAEMATLGDVLAKHERIGSLTVADLTGSETGNEAQPAAEHRKPPRRSPPAAAPEPDDKSQNPLTAICGHDYEGCPFTLIKLLTHAYFKTTGYAIAEHDEKKAAGFIGMAMSLKSVILVLTDAETAAGLDALKAWAGICEAPADWQAALDAFFLSTDDLNLDDDELRSMFGEDNKPGE